MVCYPNFDAAGWTFIGILIAMWTGAIMILSIISNIFGLYRLETLNKLICLVFICAVFYTLLWYFPQEDKVTPINKIKYGEIPSKADIEKGLKRFKFNFDFVRRNARVRLGKLLAELLAALPDFPFAFFTFGGFLSVRRR